MNGGIIGPKDIERLAKIVQELTGNQVQEKNHSMLESRLRSRMIKLGHGETSQYWSHFEANEDAERQVLQGLMTTHYTFFFREYAHFEALEQWVNNELPRLKARYAKDGTPLRIWSAACSRGQEAYSLAMFLEVGLLQKHGVPYEIFGSDIDAESVQYAKNGVYPIKEVNTIPHQYLSGFWKKGTGAIKDFAAVHPKLRERTSFDKLNLLELKAFPKQKNFDVIFARNVFIYFSEENVQKIALGLEEHLLENGLFISGVSEPLRFEKWPLVTVGPSCYERPNKTAAATPATAAAPTQVAPVSTVVALTGTKYSVLCVDDSPTIQTLIKKIFSQDPLCEKVGIANNGKEAREKLNAEKYDLITLDIHMPIMGGIEFMETQYRKKIDPPVLMVSSVNRTDIDLATKSLSLGAFDYVEKPAMNNLKKSIDEILTKAKMAIRSKSQALPEANREEFDQSISQKIVVPDASVCLRWIRSSGDPSHLVEAVVKGQNHEYRSPALVVCVPDNMVNGLEALVLKWTERTVSRLHDGNSFLRPNQVYICAESLEPTIVAQLKTSNLSLQILSEPKGDLRHFARFVDTQLLVDESVSGLSETTLTRSGLAISDITPATSFASLSLEYFAKLRKAKAA